MWKIAIGALVVAGVLGYITYTEGTLAFKSSAEPEAISLKTLIARGAEGNPHITLTDFVLCDNFVYESQNNSKTNWNKLWIPVVTPEEAQGLGQKGHVTALNAKALFFSTKISNEATLETRLNQAQVQGMVTNRISSLDSKVRGMLQQSYPGTNFDQCLIIQEGRTPWGRSLIYLMGGGAVLALLLSIGLFIGAAVRKA